MKTPKPDSEIGSNSQEISQAQLVEIVWHILYSWACLALAAFWVMVVIARGDFALVWSLMPFKFLFITALIMAALISMSGVVGSANESLDDMKETTRMIKGHVFNLMLIPAIRKIVGIFKDFFSRWWHKDHQSKSFFAPRH